MIQSFRLHPYRYLSKVLLLLILVLNFFCPVLVGTTIAPLLPVYSKYLASKSFNKAIEKYQEASKMTLSEKRDAKYLEALDYFSSAGDLYLSLIKSGQISDGFGEKFTTANRYRYNIYICIKMPPDRVGTEKDLITVGLWF